MIQKLDHLNIPSSLILFVNDWFITAKWSHQPNSTWQMESPRGSSLSVLLWLININDLKDHLDSSTSNFYVDDTLTSHLRAQALQPTKSGSTGLKRSFHMRVSTTQTDC